MRSCVLLSLMLPLGIVATQNLQSEVPPGVVQTQPHEPSTLQLAGASARIEFSDTYVMQYQRPTGYALLSPADHELDLSGKLCAFDFILRNVNGTNGPSLSGLVANIAQLEARMSQLEYTVAALWSAGPP